MVYTCLYRMPVVRHRFILPPLTSHSFPCPTSYSAACLAHCPCWTPWASPGHVPTFHGHRQKDHRPPMSATYHPPDPRLLSAGKAPGCPGGAASSWIRLADLSEPWRWRPWRAAAGKAGAPRAVCFALVQSCCLTGERSLPVGPRLVPCCCAAMRGGCGSGSGACAAAAAGGCLLTCHCRSRTAAGNGTRSGAGQSGRRHRLRCCRSVCEQ